MIFLANKMNTKEIISFCEMFNTDTGRVVLGALLAILTQWIFALYNKSKSERNNLRILYFDMINIAEVIKSPFDWKQQKEYPLLQYSTFWQEALIGVTILNTNDVKWIYKIYNTIYQYNVEHTRCNNMIELKAVWDSLNKIVLSDEWNSLINKIKEKVKICD